jgi:hypothetical protein
MNGPAPKQTTIIRAPRDKEHPYFSLRRKTAQDTQLSFEARGALTYLLSKPGDWDINEEDLMREGNCGRDRIRRILRELKTCGYLLQEKQTFGEKHRFNPVVLVVQEIPSTEDPSAASCAPLTENPSTDDPSTDGPSTENPTHTEYKESQKGESVESPAGVDQKTEDEKTEESTTTSESDPPAGEPPIPKADVVVDALIQSEVEKLGLLPETQKALLAKGAAYALAVTWAVRGPRVLNPAGLARSLLDGGGPPELLLKTAEVAVELGTVDRQEAERELGRREHEHLMADAHRIVEEQMPSPEPGEPERKIDTLSILPGEDESDNGLDFQGNVLTVGEAWKATLLNMQSQLGRETFNGYYGGTQAKSFRNGVLTLIPRNFMGKEMLTRYRQSWELEVSKLAGTPVQIEVAEVTR